MIIKRKTFQILYFDCLEKALKPGGIFMSFKYDSEERIAGERAFSDYTEEDIPRLLDNTQMECIEYWISGDVRNDRSGEKWLNILVNIYLMIK